MEIKSLIVGPLLTNCYILISENEAIVIDPGFDLQNILKAVGGKKLSYIILTHFHWDHTLSALRLKKKTGAKILIHRAEKQYIKFQPDQFLDGGEKIELPSSGRAEKDLLKVIHTPGHTKGSICLVFEKGIFTGDTLFKDGTGRTDLPGGSQEDLENSLKTIEKILKPGMKIYSGHGEVFEKK